MRGRLTDEQVAVLANTGREILRVEIPDNKDAELRLAVVRADHMTLAATELQERRLADLTAEEREALVFLRQWLGNNGLVYYKNYDGKKTEYDAVLVKLLSTTHNGGGDAG